MCIRDSVEIRPNKYLNLLYRFRSDSDSLDFKRNEIGFLLGTKALQLSGNYLFIKNDTGEVAFQDREELSFAISSQIQDNWSVAARSQRDLGDNGGTLFAGVNLTYEDECFKFSTDAKRSFTNNAEIKPSDDILFRLTFKNLGTVTTSAK